MRFVVSSEVDAKQAKQYVDQALCLQLVELFDRCCIIFSIIITAHGFMKVLAIGCGFSLLVKRHLISDRPRGHRRL